MFSHFVAVASVAEVSELADGNVGNTSYLPHGTKPYHCHDIIIIISITITSSATY